jgi:hypothetical protein
MLPGANHGVSMARDIDFGGSMGFTRVRQESGDRLRYVAHYYDLEGRQRSAGTFSTRREADRAWQRAEAMISLGRVGDPARGRQMFQHYVEETWLPNHEVEPSTQERHWYCLYRHIMPEFGPMRMIDVLPEHVREWVTGQKARGAKVQYTAGSAVSRCWL